MFSQRVPTGLGVFLAVVLVLVCLATAIYVTRDAPDRLPSPGSPEYLALTSAFYRGLASLQVGLLGSADQDFTRASEIGSLEPAIWGNLGLLHLRLGEFDEAASFLDRAQALAPASSDIALLQGQLESFRGRFDEGISHLERAVELNPRDLRAMYLLAQEVERAGGDNADAETQRLLEALLDIQPDNLAALLERARVAGKRSDIEALRDSVRRLGELGDGWPDIAMTQYRDLERAAEESDLPGAAVSIAFLRNVLVRTAAFRESLLAIATPSELIGEPLEQFLRLPSPSPDPSPRDGTLSFSAESLQADGQRPGAVALAVSLAGGDVPAVFVADAQQVRRVDTSSVPLPFPGGVAPTSPTASGLLALDWNADFRMDLALTGAGGLSLFLQQDDGTFVDATVQTGAGASVTDVSYSGAWSADIEMDGDLDIVASRTEAGPLVLRNNGDGTFTVLELFSGVGSLRGVTWGDLDRDGDPDAAFLDAEGSLHVFFNQQAGQFQRALSQPDELRELIAVALGDMNADGVLDLVGLDAAGVVTRASITPDREAWDTSQVASWPDLPDGAEAGTYRLFLADVDNNGAVDLVGSGPTGSEVWLADQQGALVLHPTEIPAEVFSVVDLSDDGRLDLLGLVDGQPVAMMNRGDAPYHWQVVRPRALMSAGDQRINTFGVGGEIEIRSGLLFQKHVLSGTSVHFGLGTRTKIDVARIVWPNGVVQAEFDVAADQAIVTEQRLKGSCPWVFAYDGAGMQFVTDFLWRSPLGLRINAQDTATVTQTEDWVKIGGEQLVPRDGSYDVRITAELWETHFFDHVSLMVVDHPAELSVWVDERFAPTAPELTVHATTALQPLAGVWDDSGRDVSDLVDRQDGRYLGTFGRGAYQGVTRDHFVELDLGEDVPRDRSVWLVGQGWVYPTDSSINAAMAQGRHPAPRGLALEAQTDDGDWVIVHPDLGFPAGKNKTVLIDLSAVLGRGRVPRLRLRTNLEVYWDRLAYASAVDEPQLETTRLAPASVDLRYRGFSKTTQAGPHAPEIPLYDLIANTLPRWRDLVGYYTRFGEVGELLARVDDRYVIMNAGDELRLRFAALPQPRAGWTRDFVLVGDGWVKDGDYNTAFSKTVGPLPSHDKPDYRGPLSELEQDPVHRRGPEDWQRYHTRFVTPREFLAGLRPRSASTSVSR